MNRDDDIRGMVHGDDPSTSRVAARKIKVRLGTLHRRVYAAVDRYMSADGQGITDEELERLSEFNSYGPSTIRKRRSELYQAGHIASDGERVNTRGQKMLTWRTAKQSAGVSHFPVEPITEEPIIEAPRDEPTQGILI